MDVIEMRFALMRDLMARDFPPAKAAAMTSEAMRFVETGEAAPEALPSDMERAVNQVAAAQEAVAAAAVHVLSPVPALPQ